MKTQYLCMTASLALAACGGKPTSEPVMGGPPLPAAGGAAPSTATGGPIQDLRLVLSAELEKKTWEKLEGPVMNLVYTAPVGTRFTVYDATNLRTVTSFAISETASNQRQARLNKLRQPLAALVGWFAERKGASPKESLAGEGRMDLPEALKAVSQDLSPRSALLVVGSPMYVNEAEPAFNFLVKDGDKLVWRVPTDGHLGTTESGSPFGVLGGREAMLQGASLHLVYPKATIFPTPLAKQRIGRFLHLWVWHQNGKQVRFDMDLAAAFRDIWRSDLPASPDQVNHKDAKIEMVTLLRTTDARTIAEKTTVGDLEALQNRLPLPPEEAQAQPRTEKEVLERFEREAKDARLAWGLLWSAPCDLDAWFFPDGKEEEFVCFNQKELPGVRYVHDYTAPNADIDWEQILVTREVDLSQAMAYVNLFDAKPGLTAPVKGKVMVRYQGKTHVAEFEIAASQGDRAKGRKDRDRHAQWARIDLAKIVGSPAASSRSEGGRRARR